MTGPGPEEDPNPRDVLGFRDRRRRGVPGSEFWPDSLSYVDTHLGHVRGLRQVSDAYLVSLAAARDDAMSATLDEELVEAFPERTGLIPR